MHYSLVFMLQIPCDIGLVERVPCDGEVQGLIPSKVTPKNATSKGLKPVSSEQTLLSEQWELAPVCKLYFYFFSHQNDVIFSALQELHAAHEGRDVFS